MEFKRDMKKADFPPVILELIRAQEHFDSKTYADCFTENAVVFDEGKNHNGKSEIEAWIAKANEEYEIVMKPLGYDEQENILSAEILGRFTGSPIVLNYRFRFEEGLIESLKITG